MSNPFEQTREIDLRIGNLAERPVGEDPAQLSLSPDSLNHPRLIVEGWRFLPHSYALVNQYQLLEFLKLPINVSVRDIPFYRSHWAAQSEILAGPANKAIRAIRNAQASEFAEVTLRVFAPFNFSPSDSPLTAVFATLEQQAIRRRQLARGQSIGLSGGEDPDRSVLAITPSRWSAEGFYKARFRHENVRVIPHGVDTTTFRPMRDVGRTIRARLGIELDTFVFLTVGSMSGNKGIDLLLRGFSEVNRRLPHTRLLLKGLDSLYASKDFLAKALASLPASDHDRIGANAIYLSSAVSASEMANLYQAADAYVSPYRAEGFNLPVLEAMASGLPVICTGGGATDDFALDTFTRKISSKKIAATADDQELAWLEPDLDDLIATMIFLAESSTWRSTAAAIGLEHARTYFNWSHVTALLADALFNNTEVV